MSAIDTVTHSVQAETQAQFDTMVEHLNAYTTAARQPPVLNRVDDAANLRVTYAQEVPVNLDPPPSE